MRSLKSILLFTFLIGSQFSHSQIDYGREICRQLTLEKLHGRGYVNGGDSLAAHFIATEFAKLHVSPIKKSYYQFFTFPVNTFPNDISVKINGRELVLGQDYIPHEGSNEVVGLWKFRRIKTAEWLDNIASLKTIVDSISAGYYNSVIIENEHFKGDTLATYREVKSTLQSVAHVMEIVDPKLTFSVATRQLNHGAITVLKNALPDSIFSIETTIVPVFNKTHSTKNVIAYLPAKKKKKKAPYIFFTAHYDHLGRIGEQVYFPGASDNASGVSMLLTLAKHFKKNPSNYNLVFIAFAGEEAGLIGSKYYVENPLIPLDKIKFLFNLDLMGNGEDGISIVNGTVFEEAYDLLQEINQEKNYLAVIHKRGKAANSDHYFFTEAGVPSVFIYTLGKNTNYHDIYDVYQDLSFAKFQEIVNLLIDFTERL